MFEDELMALATDIEPIFVKSNHLDGIKPEPTHLTSEQVRILKDVKIEVDVIINGLTVSAGELVDLSPNQLIEFNLPNNNFVTLAISGEVIGKAALVMVNGQLALEVTEVRRAVSSEIN